MDPKLQYLLKNRPSIIRNSFIVLLIWIPFSILMLAFTVAGIACLFIAKAEENKFLKPLVDEGKISELFATQIHDYAWLSAIIFLILGVLSLLVVWLCRRTMQRNLFLIELENWKAEQEEKEKGGANNTKILKNG